MITVEFTDKEAIAAVFALGTYYMGDSEDIEQAQQKLIAAIEQQQGEPTS